MTNKIKTLLYSDCLECKIDKNGNLKPKKARKVTEKKAIKLTVMKPILIGFYVMLTCYLLLFLF